MLMLSIDKLFKIASRRVSKIPRHQPLGFVNSPIRPVALLT
jgi:hypothetical protein